MSKTLKGIIWKLIIMALITLFITIFCSLRILEIWDIIKIILVLFIPMGLLIFAIFIEPLSEKYKSMKKNVILISIVLMIVVSFIVLFPICKVYNNFVENMIVIFGLLTVIILCLISNIILIRNMYRSSKLRKVINFKNSLKNMEIEQLKKLINENPNYVYDILPYTYALGISELWINKLRSINVNLPTWFCGYESESSTYKICYSIEGFMNYTKGIMITYI